MSKDGGGSSRSAPCPGTTGHGILRLDLLSGTYASYLNDPGAVEPLESAVTRARAASLPIDRLVVDGACCLAAVTAHLGDIDAAQRHARTAAELAAETGDATLVALARDLAGHVASYAGDAATALEATLAGIADARRAGDRFDIVNLLGSATESLVELGRTDEAVDVADEAFELTKDIDVGPVVTHILMMRGMALTQAGRIPEARGCLVEGLRIGTERFPDRLTVASILTILAVAASIEGDDAGAARLWEPGTPSSTTRAPWRRAATAPSSRLR